MLIFQRLFLPTHLFISTIKLRSLCQHLLTSFNGFETLTDSVSVSIDSRDLFFVACSMMMTEEPVLLTTSFETVAVVVVLVVVMVETIETGGVDFTDLLFFDLDFEGSE